MTYRLLAVLVLMVLSGCSQPTEGEIALAEMADMMRGQTDIVYRGDHLGAVFEDCSNDCSGHRAGYLWALDQSNLYHEDDCPEPDNHSFNHGCRMGVIAASFE